MSFMASLNLPDLSKLINDPIVHDVAWPAMPAKLPSDILTFEGEPVGVNYILNLSLTLNYQPGQVSLELLPYMCEVRQTRLRAIQI